MKSLAPMLRRLLAATLLTALPAAAATVDANFTAATTVPVSAAGYTATGNTVNFTLNFAPPVGTHLTAVQITGLDFIQGTFDNLAQGQTVQLTYGGITYSFVANYFGGTGNDLVLQWPYNRMLAWGSNYSGELGNNTKPNIGIPVSVQFTGALLGKKILTLAAGGTHNLALCSDGSLAAWGNNDYGQLGNNSMTGGSVPVAVDRTGVLAGKTIAAITAAYTDNLVLCTDGTLATWGYNYFGQLGNGSNTMLANVPVLAANTGLLADKTVVAISGGSNHFLVLCSDGTLATWGNNASGQLGNNSTTQSNVPVLVDRSGVLSGKTIVAISGGGNHSLALCSDGTLATWGRNDYGQLGNSSTTRSLVPVLVTRTGALSGRTVVGVAAGTSHCVAFCSDGRVASWGYNGNGQLGTISTSNSSVPVLVYNTGALAGKSVAAIALGGNHDLALCSDGTLTAWGSNSERQLGNNSINQSTVPAFVNISALQPGERIVTINGGAAFSLAMVASPPPPLATTLAASAITGTSASVNGNVNAQGVTTTVTFDYGLTPSYGTTVAATPASVSGTATAFVSSTLAGLAVGATYHYRVTATNANGTVTGADMTFTTNRPPVFAGYPISTPYQTAATVTLRKLLAKASDPDGDAITVTAAGPTSAQGGTAVLQASAILYSPPAGFSGTDTFPITLTDARGATSIGTVTVTVGQAPTSGGTTTNPPKITPLTGGRLELKFQGIPGRSYQIQRSTDMSIWATIATASADSHGTMSFTDETPPQPSAFYRLALP